MKTLEGDYERTTEELELLEEELKEGEVRRVGLTDELDELKEELLKLKVVVVGHLHHLGSSIICLRHHYSSSNSRPIFKTVGNNRHTCKSFEKLDQT